jgi:heat-inducible transcriptional repressor
LSRSKVRHVELVLLSETRLMMVLIVDSGRVEQRMVDCSAPIDASVLADLRARLNALVADQPFSSVPDALTSFDERFANDDRPMVRAVIGAVMEAVTERLDERVVLGGTSHLASYQTSFPMAIQPVLEALEEQVVLLRLLGESSAEETVTVRIGHENPISSFESTSVVTARYGHAEQPVAALGVVGPTHMDYSGTMGTVQAVAQYIGRILSDQ